MYCTGELNSLDIGTIVRSVVKSEADLVGGSLCKATPARIEKKRAANITQEI